MCPPLQRPSVREAREGVELSLGLARASTRSTPIRSPARRATSSSSSASSSSAGSSTGPSACNTPVLRPAMLTGTQLAHTGSGLPRRYGHVSMSRLSPKNRLWPPLATGHSPGLPTWQEPRPSSVVETAWRKCARLESATSSSTGWPGTRVSSAWRTTAEAPSSLDSISSPVGAGPRLRPGGARSCAREPPGPNGGRNASTGARGRSRRRGRSPWPPPTPGGSRTGWSPSRRPPLAPRHEPPDRRTAPGAARGPPASAPRDCAPPRWPRAPPGRPDSSRTPPRRRRASACRARCTPPGGHVVRTSRARRVRRCSTPHPVRRPPSEPDRAHRRAPRGRCWSVRRETPPGSRRTRTPWTTTPPARGSCAAPGCSPAISPDRR